METPVKVGVNQAHINLLRVIIDSVRGVPLYIAIPKYRKALR